MSAYDKNHTSMIFFSSYQQIVARMQHLDVVGGVFCQLNVARKKKYLVFGRWYLAKCVENFQSQKTKS